MPKRCPPGMYCTENMTLTFYFIVIVLSIYIGVQYIRQLIIQNPKIINEKIVQPLNLFPPSLPFSHGLPMNNPYIPPVRHPPYLPPNMPISTQRTGGGYRQIGFLTRSNGSEILPLMGRLLIVGRDKWNYYCISDTNNSVKLPVSQGGKSCTSEYGCNNIDNGDTVYVEGYDDAFKVTLYDNSSNSYVPL